MAEYVMPPEMEAFVDGCESVAMDTFDPAAFDADPSAAFADTMGAVMDYMGDAGMPPEMMTTFQDVATGCFDSYMGDNPDAAPMECFDAVGAGIDHHMADMPPDMNCADMAGDFPPPPTDFGEFMNECPPYGDYAGGDNYDAAAHPHEGDMPGDPGPGTAPPGSPPPGDMASGPVTAPGEAPPTFDGGEGPGTAPPGSPPPGDMASGPVTAPGEAPPTFDGGEGPGTTPDPLFGDAGPADGGLPPGSPPPGDMGPGPVTAPGEAPPTFDGGEGPGTAPPDGLEEMQSTMDDASANAPVTAPGEAPPTFDGDVADGPGTVPPNDDTDDVV